MSIDESQSLEKRRGKSEEKKKKRVLFFFLIMLILCLFSYGGYTAYKMYEPTLKSQEGLRKADESLKNKPDVPKVPSEVTYERGYTYGKLRIPSINLEVALTEGLSPAKEDTGKDFALLDYTVAHVNTTKHPGQNSQIFLAGHNDMQFNHLGEIKDNAEVYIDMPYGTFKYIVHAAPAKDNTEQKVGMVVQETRGDAIQPELEYEELILQTCYPLNQYRETPYRFLIYAYPENQNPKVSLPGYGE